MSLVSTTRAAPVVACAMNGDLFCRECAISDLLAQRQEIKRLEKERGEARRRLAEDNEREREEAKEREVKEFEMVSMGLEGSRDQSQNHKKRKASEVAAQAEGVVDREREVEVAGKRKKMFELDEKELARVVSEEEERLKDELKKEKVTSLFFYGTIEYMLIENSPNQPNPPCPHSGCRHSPRAPTQTKLLPTRP